jgi:DNA-directed RNA polymerase subunit omega
VKPFPIEELVDRCGSRFTVVVAAAKRAKQIKEGAPPLVNLPTRNPLTIALHEIAAGLVEITEAPIIEVVPSVSAVDHIGELAAPEVVEALIEKSAVVEEEMVVGFADDYDSELDEAVAADLDEEAEEDLDEDEDEDLEDLELDEDDEDEEEEEVWEEE